MASANVQRRRRRRKVTGKREEESEGREEESEQRFVQLSGQQLLLKNANGKGPAQRMDFALWPSHLEGRRNCQLKV